MESQKATFRYTVAFKTYGEADPSRLGTADRAIARMQLWAMDGEEAILLAKAIAKAKRMEWLGLIAAEPSVDVVLERILNDPLNGYDFMDEVNRELGLDDGREPKSSTLELVTQ